MSDELMFMANEFLNSDKWLRAANEGNTFLMQQRAVAEFGEEVLRVERARVEAGAQVRAARWLELITEQDVREAYQSAPNWHSVLSSLQCRAIKKYQEAEAALAASEKPQ